MAAPLRSLRLAAHGFRGRPASGRERERDDPPEIHRWWVLANVAGSAIGLGLFALIGHGLSGPHDEQDPTLGEIAAHGAGLLVAGAVLALAQKIVLERYANVARWFLPVMSVALTAAFLFGAYVLRSPVDFLLSYAAVGAVVERAARPMRAEDGGRAWRPAAVTALWFTLASFLGMLALSLVAPGRRVSPRRRR